MAYKFVKPEYALGDTAFYMQDNKIVEAQVLGVRLVAINKDAKDPSFLSEYFFEVQERVGSMYSHQWIPEANLHRTRDELIKSL